MNTILAALTKSPKTTACGLIALCGTVLMLTGKAEAGMTLIGLAVGIGQILSRDVDRTDDEAGANAAASKRIERQTQTGFKKR